MKKVNAEQRKNNDIELELNEEMVTKIEIAINPAIEKAETGNKEVLSPQNQVSILVAEVDELYFSCIETILLPFNYKILHAKDGHEAVNIFRSNNDIKLILMDLVMPTMDGFTAIKEIRKTDPAVPIIAQTAYFVSGTKEKAMISGCTEFFPKPIEYNDLIMTVEKYISCLSS